MAREWLNDAIFYEIYPQSFLDTNGDGIGDFQGIIDKLDYICDLGCNAIWMNPCFKSPFGDAGYDVEDFYEAAPRYGTNADLKRLFDEMHKRGMHILLDLVAGHTAITHKWFKESMKDEINPYTDRYVWSDTEWGGDRHYNWLCGISERRGAAMVNFFAHQPALNYGFYEIKEPWQQPVDAPGPQSTLEELKNIMRFWLSMGCDGFRVDMAHSLVKNDPESKGTIALWKNVRDFLNREFPEAVLVSEWGEPQKSLEGGFHMDFLLHFGPSHYNDLFRCEEPFFSRRGKGNAYEFVKKYESLQAETAGKGFICIPSGNHDMDRLARSLSGSELKVAFGFLMSMPGVPFIYYGDEIGMRYVEGLKSVEGGYLRTGSRSPMQWDDTTNAGFSQAPSERLYIKMDPDPNRPTVKKEMEDSHSLLREVERLTKLRKEHKALGNKGDVKFIYAKEKTYPLAYIRSYEDEKILVVVNPSYKDASFESDLMGSELIHSIGDNATMDGSTITAPAGSISFIKL
ncbi:MAG: alpha-glucosidase C-terminal domain-containing protein [Acetatifactor sp.]|nr:alpha-glucosidase C-terminal domain-containing protein [Acetatifactor sp.]